MNFNLENRMLESGCSGTNITPADIGLDFCPLALQALLKSLLCFGYCAAVGFRINPHCRALILITSQGSVAKFGKGDLVG